MGIAGQTNAEAAHDALANAERQMAGNAQRADRLTAQAEVYAYLALADSFNRIARAIEEHGRRGRV